MTVKSFLKNETNILYFTIVLAVLNLANDIRSFNYQSLVIMVAVTTTVFYLFARKLSFSILMGLVLSSVLQEFLGLKEGSEGFWVGGVSMGKMNSIMQAAQQAAKKGGGGNNRNKNAQQIRYQFQRRGKSYGPASSSTSNHYVRRWA